MNKCDIEIGKGYFACKCQIPYPEIDKCIRKVKYIGDYKKAHELLEKIYDIQEEVDFAYDDYLEAKEEYEELESNGIANEYVLGKWK